MIEPESATQPPSDAFSDPPVSERRAFIRYPRHLELFWQLLGLPAQDMIGAIVFDVSVSGVGVYSDHELPVGKTVIIRLHSATQGWSSHLVRIKYCKQVIPNQFQVGCSFVRPLKADQLRDLLS